MLTKKKQHIDSSKRTSVMNSVTGVYPSVKALESVSFILPKRI